MSQTNDATFFLSTGRCGTQWLQKTLSAVYRDKAKVTHEPVRAAYSAKRYLRAGNFDPLLSSGRIARHLASIKETLETKRYIETGWPGYAVLPFFIGQLEDRVRIVHLVRHPVNAALSMATHKPYGRPDWIKGFALTPFDRGIVQKELASAWPTMNSYEQCLFWWTEINLYALELQELYPDIPFFFLRYEDLFGADGEAMKALVAFMGLGYVPTLEAHKAKTVDKFQFKSYPVDWTLIFKYPKTVALAERFGYDLGEFPTQKITARYFETKTIRHLIQGVRQIGWMIVTHFKS